VAVVTRITAPSVPNPQTFIALLCCPFTFPSHTALQSCSSPPPFVTTLPLLFPLLSYTMSQPIPTSTAKPNTQSPRPN
jgi:hypothetical protein